MDSNMIGAIAIVLPFLFAMFILHHTFKLKRQAMETEALKARAESSDLENRVRVLEKIVTDNNPMLAQEIEALRALPEYETRREEVS